MEARITVRVDVVDEIGRPVASVEQTTRKNAGGNPAFFLSEVMPPAEEVAGGTVKLAALAVLQHSERRGRNRG